MINRKETIPMIINKVREQMALVESGRFELHIAAAQIGMMPDEFKRIYEIWCKP